MTRHLFMLILAVAVITAVACSPEIDRKKFGRAGLTAEGIQKSITTGPQYGLFSGEVKLLSEEVALLNGSVKSVKEKELLKAYSDLLAIYNDSLVLWKYKLEFARYGFVPKGLIYVNQDIEPIVEKYNLDTTKHVFGPTRQTWKSIPEDSIQAIWANAAAQYAHVRTLMDN